MIVQKTWPQYIAIRIVILLMRDLPWLCLGYFFIVFALGGVVAIAHPVSLVIEALGAIEILFYVVFFLPYRWFLQTWKPYNPPPLDQAARAQLFYKGLDLVPDGEAFIRKWALNAPMDDIRQGNMKEWLLWALFEMDANDELVGKAVDAELDQYVQDAMQQLNIPLKQGKGLAEVMKLCFDPVLIQHRTLLYYSIIGLLDTAMTAYLLLKGYSFYRQTRGAFFTCFPLRPMNFISFKKSAAPRMSYWYRPHRSKNYRPILFIHGLGIGLIPYMFFLATLPKDVGILAVEMLPISSRITTYPLPSTPELVAMIASCVEQQCQLHPSPGSGLPGVWDEFVLIGNSYGTLLMAPLLQHASIGPRVAATILIDPVSLLLHLPEVAFNFTRREPQSSVRGRPGHGNEWEIWWASATDAGTAHALARRFCWRECILWREMLTPSLRNAEEGVTTEDSTSSNALYGLGRTGMRSTVIIGGIDCVAAPTAMASYVHSGQVSWTQDDVEEWKKSEWTGTRELELLYLEGKDHGQGIMVPWPDKRIRPVVETYCRRDDNGFANESREAR